LKILRHICIIIIVKNFFVYEVFFVLSVIEDSKKKKVPISIGKVKKLAALYRVKGKVSRLMELL